MRIFNIYKDRKFLFRYLGHLGYNMIWAQWGCQETGNFFVGGGDVFPVALLIFLPFFIWLALLIRMYAYMHTHAHA